MNQLAVIDTQTNVEAYRASTNAAELCKGIVLATASTIQGRKFVSVEGWMAIAIAHGCTAGARDVERVEGGVRAIGEIRRMSDGHIISTAEGFVGEDEPTWFGGQSRGKTLPKRADYAIRAMAQTRAISRACRSAFAHVVVMMNAGLATTPAEEVPHEGFDSGGTLHNPQTGEILDNQPERVAGISKIKQRLRVMMDAGNAPDMTFERFRELKRQNKDDLKTIRDANHSWWTGDGEDFEGFGPWIDRRTAELSEPNEAAELIRSLKECDTKEALDNWKIANMDAVETLDGAASRTIQTALDLQESNIDAMDAVNA